MMECTMMPIARQIVARGEHPCLSGVNFDGDRWRQSRSHGVSARKRSNKAWVFGCFSLGKSRPGS